MQFNAHVADSNPVRTRRVPKSLCAMNTRRFTLPLALVKYRVTAPFAPTSKIYQLV